ncbi:MAG: ABC transporter substrate-binding protein [Bacteriovoracaceae bacterium]
MRFQLLVVLLFLAACAQKSGVKPIDESQISENARNKINEARELVRSTKYKQAISKLAELDDNHLEPVEKALKYNLKGVTLFNMGEADKALLNFEVAEKYTPKDTQLYSQVELNMASGFYKLGHFNELKTHLMNVDRKQLTDIENKKYAQLANAYGTKFNNYRMIASSNLILMNELKNTDEVQKSTYYEPLKNSFDQLNEKDKIEILEEFNGSKNLAVAYLGQLEAEKRYVEGDKSGAKDVVSWLKSEYSGNQEIEKFVANFETRLDNSTSINENEIGIVLPLSGEKASYGQKALSGIETGLKVLELKDVKINTEDNADNPTKAAEAVTKLIQEKRVTFIIGGLFPESAKAEYLEARKYGVLYISLSQINLPAEQKNHHLIEVQGSIESQVEALLSEEMIKKFGNRLGVIFPENEGGQAYMDEIWRKALEKKIQITSMATFPKNTHDYRDTAQLFLGLKFPRERSEEVRILDDVYSLEKSSIRRVQTLTPVLDFDWVFLATYPHEATQLINTLGYYDANKIKVVGGPSWVSKSMVKEQKNLGTLYFVGDDPKDINQGLLNKFQQAYGKPASLIEVIALDATKLGAEALKAAGRISSRDEFDSGLKSAGKLHGLATDWTFKDGIWLKRMNSMAITRGEIVKLFSGDTQI